jgi:hypothetical protein
MTATNNDAQEQVITFLSKHGFTQDLNNDNGVECMVFKIPSSRITDFAEFLKTAEPTEKPVPRVTGVRRARSNTASTTDQKDEPADGKLSATASEKSEEEKEAGAEKSDKTATDEREHDAKSDDGAPPRKVRRGRPALHSSEKSKVPCKMCDAMINYTLRSQHYRTHIHTDAVHLRDFYCPGMCRRGAPSRELLTQSPSGDVLAAQTKLLAPAEVRVDHRGNKTCLGCGGRSFLTPKK